MHKQSFPWLMSGQILGNTHHTHSHRERERQSPFQWTFLLSECLVCISHRLQWDSWIHSMCVHANICMEVDALQTFTHPHKNKERGGSKMRDVTEVKQWNPKLLLKWSVMNSVFGCEILKAKTSHIWLNKADMWLYMSADMGMKVTTACTYYLTSATVYGHFSQTPNHSL